MFLTDMFFLNSSAIGVCLIIICSVFFLYYTLWVIVSPFYEPISLLFPSTSYALVIPAFMGMCFIGSLIAYTIFALSVV